jgi:hypothetical protein
MTALGEESIYMDIMNVQDNLQNMGNKSLDKLKEHGLEEEPSMEQLQEAAKAQASAKNSKNETNDNKEKTNGKNGDERVGLESGVDFLQQDPFMNAKYQKGPWLVYDCAGGYWACTGKPEYLACEASRKTAMLDYEPQMPCAHFKKFKSRQECWVAQTKFTSRGRNYRFCLHPRQQKLEFSY